MRVDRVVDATGRVLSESRSTADNPRVRAAQSGSSFPCVSDAQRPGLTAHQPLEAEYHGKNDFAQFLFFPYSQDSARTDEYGRWRQQWLICGVGGADGNNGSRMIIAGPGVFYRDGTTTWKLGQIWKEGSTPPSYTINLGFETQAPVKISGGISQTPVKSLKGSPRPPFDSPMDAYSRNGTNGWWDANCTGYCGKAEGSADYQGSVTQGLWEFPQGSQVDVWDFEYRGFFEHYCANPNGCG